MARKNFSEFETRITPVTSDFLIGYTPAGPIEIKATIQSLLQLFENTIDISNSLDNLQITNLTAVNINATTQYLLSGVDPFLNLVRSNSALETPSVNVSAIQNIVTLSQAAYDALLIKRPGSLYFISDSTPIDSDVRSLTAIWDNTTNTILTLSSNWNSVYTTVQDTSGNWNSAYTTIQDTSGNLLTLNTIVQTNSAVWEQEFPEIISTVTDYLSTNNVVISSLEVTELVTAKGSNVPITVINESTDKIFTDNDTNKVFHFDTTSDNLIATFPDNLTEGFNAAIMNVGTNSLEISATNLKALGVIIVEQYGSAFIYKQNNDVFAVGRLV